MKRIYRSHSDKKLAGVCGGVGEYFDVDPTVIRLATVVVALATAFIPVAIAYVIAWVIVPEAPASAPQ